MTEPLTPAGALARLEPLRLPEAVLEVLRVLTRAGHEAVLVGGAVRDALLGVDQGDFDIATAARPEAVQALFRRTIPTGLEHGTVTVLVGGKGERAIPVEVTTYRGESDYDGRRPGQVAFHDDLREDLARRDFTVNAFAWDPLGHRFVDAWGGLEDLVERRIRAVRDPLERFTEDGLRTLRAVRFCATLQFSLDPATQAAIGQTLAVLDRVSGERILVELLKLLSSPRPSSGLVPMLETNLFAHVLWPAEDRARAVRSIDAVDALPADPVLRLARLALPEVQGNPDGRARLEATLERLRPSRELRSRVAALTGEAAQALARADDPVAIRTAVWKLGPEHRDDAMAVLELGEAAREAIFAACDGAPLRAKDVAVTGRDLIAAGIGQPGPQLGALLDRLGAHVRAHPADNEKSVLLEVATRLTAIS